MSEPARQAVSHLDVQWQSGAYDLCMTGWLTALPTAFPHLISLRVGRLWARLPPQDQLPQLRDLHLILDAKKESPFTTHRPDSVCESVARYLPQLSVLSLSHSRAGYVPWEQVLTGTSHTLTHLHTTDTLSQRLVGLVRTHAPAVTDLSCGHVWLWSDEHRYVTWGVKTLKAGHRVCAASLANLPKSSGGLTLLPSTAGVVCIDLQLQDMGGLSSAVREHLPHWQFAAPCHAQLTVSQHAFPAAAEGSQLSDTAISNFCVAAETAVTQLISLPPQSTVHIMHHIGLTAMARSIAAGINAASPLAPHISYVAPLCTLPNREYMAGDDSAIDAFCDLASTHPVAHAQVRGLRLGQSYANRRWPWQSLTVSDVLGVEATPFSHLLRLPDPTQGQYELRIQNLQADACEYTEEMLAAYNTRLQHLTFVVLGSEGITLHAPPACSASLAARAMRQTLQVLGQVRWRLVGNARFTLRLRGWVITRELVSELSALPTFTASAQLCFHNCVWLTYEPQLRAPHQAPWRPVVMSASYTQQIPAVIPTCYSTIVVERHVSLTAKHLVSICQGAAARGVGYGRLRLRVGKCASLEQRAEVERKFDEGGCGQWVEDIVWD